MSDNAELAVDLVALADELRSLNIPVAGSLSGARIGLGQSNLTYLVSDEDGHRLIVRRPPRGVLLASAHDVERESRILTALQGTSVPVPQVYCVLRDARISDAPVVVMEFVDGLVIDRMQTAVDLPEAVRRALSLDLPRGLAAIHGVDLAASGLETLSSHSPYANRQLKRWSRQWEDSRTRELGSVDAMTDLLRRNAPPQRELSLVHGDFHLKNVIASPSSGQLRAILDWELSTLGDPLADLGTLLAYWAESGEDEIGQVSVPSLKGFADRAELVRAYLEASGRDGATIGYWHAFGLWKRAVIAEGVLRRARDEPSNAAEGGPSSSADQIVRIADRAWTVAHAAGLR